MGLYILVDCNNFYVSCERVFNPKLENRPVIVLSNNDGCVVSRSKEAKNLSIGMGVPFFQVQELCKRHGVAVLSSNFELYGDISRRVMRILEEYAPVCEVYSIDEAFLFFPEKEIAMSSIVSLCHTIRKDVLKHVGIPVSLGVAPTKTLAKVASSLAKQKIDTYMTVIASSEDEADVLDSFPVEGVWGIGKKWKERLYKMGIRTAGDFRNQNPSYIRSHLGVVGEKILWELRGVSCLSEEKLSSKKNIMSSRSFGKIVDTLEELHQAIATYTAQACASMRAQNSYTQTLCVYVETRNQEEHRFRSRKNSIVSLIHPTNDTSIIIKEAKRGISQLFSRGEQYKKCGIILMDVLPEKVSTTPDLFHQPPSEKRQRCMQFLDAINTAYGKNTLFFGAMGVSPGWKMKQEKCSHRYTTNWSELAVALAQ